MSLRILDRFRNTLNRLREKGLLRELIHRDSSQGRFLSVQNRQLLNFGSNDYLGLAGSKELIEAAIEATKLYGAGSGASRLLAGGTELYKVLEQKIAQFKQTESALVFNSGYTANTTVLPALTGHGWVIFSDELNHASIIDGCRLSRAEVRVYPHRDVEALEGMLKDCTGPKLIVTDSVFSMDGDIAPLKDLCELAERYETLLYIDDAHATGVLGRGRGSLAHFGLSPSEYIIQMGTFSKALGSFGAFVAGFKELTRYLINTSRGLIFSTALPPSCVGASLRAVEIISMNTNLIDRLWQNRDLLYNSLRQLGLHTGPTETPIIPVIVKDNDTALNLSRFLFDRGFYCPAIRYPAVKTPRLRLTVTAAHETEDIEHLINTLKEALRCGLL